MKKTTKKKLIATQSTHRPIDKSKTAVPGSFSSMGTNRTDGSNNQVFTVVATSGYGNEVISEISYTDARIVGSGSFGTVFQAKLMPSQEVVAIKKVLQDKRFKNRELMIMRRLKHPNIVTLKYFFYSNGDARDEVYLNLVMEYIPDTLYKITRQYGRAKQTVPTNYVRIYIYQLFRSLAYLHSFGYCHRDIKPQNMLLDTETAVLKLCDLGSAKQLVEGEGNVAYICSRYYRAPELIFGATNYSTKIDMWSAGCVLAELLLGQLIFPGESGVDQIVEIVKVMGTPTPEELTEMNPSHKQYQLPHMRAHPWPKVFRIRTSKEAIDLVSKLLIYTPRSRISPLTACAHPFFNELRDDPRQLLPNGRALPPLFNFNDYERSIEPSLMPMLIPKQEKRENEPAPRRSAGEDKASTKPQKKSAPQPQTISGQLIQQLLYTAPTKESDTHKHEHEHEKGKGDHLDVGQASENNDECSDEELLDEDVADEQDDSLEDEASSDNFDVDDEDA